MLTLDQLQRRGWSLVNRYALCKEDVEFIDHILLHCAKARILWLLVFSLFDIPWVISTSGRDTLLGWQVSFVRKERRKAWRVASFFGLYRKKEIKECLKMRRRQIKG